MRMGIRLQLLARIAAAGDADIEAAASIRAFFEVGSGIADFGDMFWVAYAKPDHQ